jgi:hypothetical protein
MWLGYLLFFAVMIGLPTVVAYMLGYHRGQWHAYDRAGRLQDAAEEAAWRAGYHAHSVTVEPDAVRDFGTGDQIEAQRRAARGHLQ